MLLAQREFDFAPSIIEYHEISKLVKIKDLIFDFLKKHDIHSNDIAILGDLNVARA